MVVIIDSVLIIYSVNPSTPLPFKCQHWKKKGQNSRRHINIYFTSYDSSAEVDKSAVDR